jgi:hypothetical protein
MQRTLLFIIISLALSFAQKAYALSLSDSTKTNVHSVLAADAPSETLRKTFESLSINELREQQDPIILPDNFLPDSVEEQRLYAHSLLARVSEEQRFLESIDALSEVELPIGIVKAGGALDYAILIDRITFTTQGATMEVFVSLALPQADVRLAFKGKIPLSAEGGISGVAKVSLLGDHYVHLNPKTLLTLKGGNQSYVEFDCNGFKGVNLSAQVDFSRDLIIPEGANGKALPPPARVTFEFNSYVQSLNDILVSVNLPAFQVNGLKDFGFHVQQATLDWSDFTNPAGIAFPKNYESPFLQGGMSNLWQGLYLQRLDVKLPSAFAERTSRSRVSVGVEKMILDEMGFTGEVFTENLIREGNMSGWQYTLDKLSLELVSNQVKGFEISGLLAIPVIKTRNNTPARFSYQAHRASNGNYIFSVGTQNEVRLPLFAADVKLFPGTQITVEEKNDAFVPSALLNGELTINVLGRGPKANFNNIRFERMIISSEAPHFTPGTFAFGREGQTSSISKFPLVINNIVVRSQGERVGLGFDVTINIGGNPEEGGFGGTGSLVVWGKQERQQPGTEPQVNEQDDWRFDNVELSGIAIRVNKPNIVSLSGSVNFFDADPTYGDGFKGSIQGTIGSLGTSISMSALFGRTTSYRYWYVDGLVSLKNPIPIIPGILTASEFGGGFYNRMKPSTQPISTTVGSTPSNVVYVPDENSLGAKMMMKVGAVRPEAMNGDVLFAIAMNRSGGLNAINIEGNATFMSLQTLGENKLKELIRSAADNKLSEKLASLIKGQVYGSMRLQFDNVNDAFHGNFDIYVNVAGGIIRGVSPGNKAGWAALHFSKTDWFVHIGTPSQPIGLEVARLFKSQSYFMMGKNLPSSPPPPSKVQELMPGVNLDNSRDVTALTNGSGFAFGLHFSVNTGDLKFLMFYGSFSAGAGLDFMLKDAGSVTCANTGRPPGIDGWYAQGQAYAYMQCKIGIKVKLRFVQGNFDILNMGVAAILQAEGPNPFWMRGVVSGQYRILGGLVKGNCQFQVTIGERCDIIQEVNPLEDVSIIAELSPAANAQEVDVFTAPQVAFNIPIGETFDITDKEGYRHLYRSTLREFKMYDGSTEIAGTFRWNPSKDVVAFDSYDILPPKKEIRIVVKIAFEEYKNAQWQTAIFSGTAIEENAESKFKTGTAPDHIPASNVANSYPLPGMYNFYPREYNQGFINLKKGQPYLFANQTEWLQKVRFTESSSQAHYHGDLSYNDAERRVYFTIPTGLPNNKFFTVSAVNIPREQSAIDENVTKIEREVLSDANTGQAVITTKDVEGSLELRDVKELYTLYMRTSLYNTFPEKARSIALSNTFLIIVQSNIFQLASLPSGQELFDRYESSSTEELKSMVQYQALLENSNWFNNFINPIIYDGYPLLGRITITSRDTNELGLIPTKSIYIDDQNYDPKVTQDNLGMPASAPSPKYKLRYNLMVPMYSDYRDIQMQVASHVINFPGSRNERFDRILLNRMPVYRYGSYRMRLNYVIPGIDKVTSSYDWEIFNNIPD